MGVISQVRAYFAVVPKARRNRVDLLRWLIRRPQLLGANAGYEVALVSSGRVPSRLKALAELKAGTLITCEFCIDIGSALARHEGITDAQLRALPSFRSSEEFSETDKLLELAEAMTRIPTRIDYDLRGRLTECFSRAQLVELTSAVAVGEPSRASQPGTRRPCERVLRRHGLRSARDRSPILMTVAT